MGNRGLAWVAVVEILVADRDIGLGVSFTEDIGYRANFWFNQVETQDVAVCVALLEIVNVHRLRVYDRRPFSFTVGCFDELIHCIHIIPKGPPMSGWRSAPMFSDKLGPIFIINVRNLELLFWLRLLVINNCHDRLWV